MHGGELALRTPLAGLGQDGGAPALGLAPLEVLVQNPSGSHTEQPGRCYRNALRALGPCHLQALRVKAEAKAE